MGLDEPELISLNKSRQRAVYQRPDGQGGWLTTTPLPADPASINYYFLKGFRAPPREEAKASSSVAEKMIDGKLVINCPIPGCQFTTVSAFGLQAHLRVHINKTKKED